MSLSLTPSHSGAYDHYPLEEVEEAEKIERTDDGQSDDEDGNDTKSKSEHSIYTDNEITTAVLNHEVALNREESQAPKAPPKSVGFWHEDLSAVRLHVWHLYLRTVFFLGIGILGILSLYWGVLFSQSSNISRISIWVVNFDTGIVGTSVISQVEKLLTSNEPTLDFKIVPPSYFNNNPINVRESVYDENAWAALIVNPDATALLRAALENGNSSYDPTGAGEITLLTARDQTITSSYITPVLAELQTEVVANFGASWTREVIQNSSISRQAIEKVPQALSPAIGFTKVDLRPFGPGVATPAVSIGLIYLIIVSFFSFSFFLPIHMKFLIPKGHPPLHIHQLILWRWIATVFAYFVLSFCYTLVSAVYLIPMNRSPASHTQTALNPNAYHDGTFLVLWMLNFVGMSALGLACENVAMVVGAPWTAMWLIFWVITNVSTGFYAIEISPGFFRWGYAWPIHNVQQATRTILFDVKSHVGLNFGILFAWVGVSTVLFPLCCYFMQWKTGRDKQSARKNQDDWLKKVADEKLKRRESRPA